jgi:hypothetical protein
LMTCSQAIKIPRGQHTEVQAWGSLKNQHKVTTPCTHTLSRASLALHLTKACAKSKDLINMYLDGLENYFSVSVASHELQQSQVTRGEALYRL